MRFTQLILLLLFSAYLNAQQTTLPSFDGEVSPEEWKDAETFTIKYEIDPGNNVPSPHLTDVFITYSKQIYTLVLLHMLI